MGGSSTVFFNDALHGWTKQHRTTGGGENWTSMGGTPQSTVSIFFTDNDTGYAVSFTGQTVKSVDGGVTWENVLPEIVNAGITDAAYVDGYVVIGGAYGDIYRAQVGCSSVQQVPGVTVLGNTLCSSLDGTVQWYRNDMPIPDGNTLCIGATTGGLYHVIVVDGFGCTSAPSQPVQVLITGVERINDRGNSRLFPNPATYVVRIDRQDNVPAVITIIDVQGRVVTTQRTTSSATTIPL